jgi:hypothetical protein
VQPVTVKETVFIYKHWPVIARWSVHSYTRSFGLADQLATYSICQKLADQYRDRLGRIQKLVWPFATLLVSPAPQGD